MIWQKENLYNSQNVNSLLLINVIKF